MDTIETLPTINPNYKVIALIQLAICYFFSSYFNAFF